MPSLKLLVLVSAVLAVVVGGVLVVSGAKEPRAPAVAEPDAGGVTAPSADPAHTRPARIRTLAVRTDTEPAPSAHPGRMRALLVAGTVPRRAVSATVLTDEDCAPDERGVSHCRNRLRLASGRTVTVRHPHRMSDVPCMTPGETVRVRRA